MRCHVLQWYLNCIHCEHFHLAAPLLCHSWSLLTMLTVQSFPSLQNANGIYTGFIKVQMELCRPITVQSSQSQGRCAPSSTETAFYLPDGCVNTLHISSTNTVREVIEALLKKFFVADNPAKFALYKRCHKEDQGIS